MSEAAAGSRLDDSMSVTSTLRTRIEAACAYWKLSLRQAQVLELIALGKCNKRIAQILGLAEVTVEAHVTALLRKSGAESRTNLAVRVWAEELDGLPDHPSGCTR